MLNNFQTVLKEKKRLSEDQFLLRFLLVEPKEIIFKPGQYLMLKINGQSRLYSIYSPDFMKNSFDLMIKIIPQGLASGYFNILKEGDRVDFQGPAGTFYLRENEKNKVFFATYTGIAPMMSMIKSFVEKTNHQIPPITLYWGLRNFQDICLVDELRDLAQKHHEFKPYICLSRETNLDQIPLENKPFFHTGRINTVWQELSDPADRLKSEYYLCGSRQVVESFNQFLYSQSIPKDLIFFEKF